MVLVQEPSQVALITNFTTLVRSINGAYALGTVWRTREPKGPLGEKERVSLFVSFCLYHYPSSFSLYCNKNGDINKNKNSRAGYTDIERV